MNGNLKILILLLVIFFLGISIKKKEYFEGCQQSLHNPTEEEIFNCYFILL